MLKMCHEPTNISQTDLDFTVSELDHLPLTSRQSLLLSNERVSQRTFASVPASNVDSIVKREEKEEDCFNELGVVSNYDAPEYVLEPTRIGSSQGLNDSSGNVRPQNNILVCGSSAEENFERVEHLEETTGDDALEHLTLKERRKILLERMAIRLPEPNLEVEKMQDSTKDSDESDLYEIKAEILSENGIDLSSGGQFSGFLEKIDSVLCKKVAIGSESGSQLSGIQENDILIAQEMSSDLSPEANQPRLSSKDDEHSQLSSDKNPRKGVKRAKRNPLPLKMNEMQPSQVKVDPFSECVMQNNDERSPITSEQVQVKREVETNGETHYENELDSVTLSSRLNHCTSAPNPSRFVKSEAETASELDEDVIDHMKLIDRLKLRSFHDSGHHEDLKSPSSGSGFSFSKSDEYSKPLRRPWKRKRTATNSIETALEEDAPGLLQVLIQQGVAVDELRLYGENEGSSVSSDDSVLDESFSELEDVISQLFYKRETGTKLLNISLSKASKVSYCLTCLFSLIEQARYLRHRKWPVEWGWCRDLQSFIFVFERHNRIVMERPEYGYATYFFELSTSATVKWQIKRLVLAMKLASCGRYQLIENKPLLVGEDMTEAEAEVLTKYGWIQNTGLGTMLNYRDRVYHDRKTQQIQTSEWRSKIAKLLVEGYDGGTIVSSCVAPHDDDDDLDDGFDIGNVKLEEPC